MSANKGLSILGVYLSEIGDIPMLTKEEEKVLYLELQKGNMEAKTRLIEANLRLVPYIAKYYTNRGVDIHDLIGEGNFALRKAAEKFDVEKGIRFGTYAAHYIAGYLKSAIAKKSHNIYIPQRELMRQQKVLNAIDNLTVKLNRKPTIEEISLECDFSSKIVNNILMLPSCELSLDDEVDTDYGGLYFQDMITDINGDVQETVITNEFNHKMHQLFSHNSLTLKEKRFLVYKYMKKMRNIDIAKMCGITRQAIDNLEKKVMKKLRKIINVEEMSMYLDYPEKGKEFIKKKIF